MSSLIFGSLGMALAFLPLQVLYVKITPKSIEGTCYAFFVGMENFSNAMISPVVGAWLNQTFIGVTNKNLLDPGNHGFLKLNILAMVLGLTQFGFIYLIPTKKAINDRMAIIDD